MAIASKEMDATHEVGASIPLVLEASPELIHLIEELAEQFKTTPAEVLLRSVALLKLFADARVEGKEIGAAEPGQPIDTEFVY